MMEIDAVDPQPIDESVGEGGDGTDPTLPERVAIPEPDPEDDDA